MKNKRRMLGLSATASLLSLSAILASCGKEVKQYTVTFMNGTETVTSEKVQEGSNVSVPTQLMDQADFNGWYSDSSLTTPFDFGSTIKKDITVYANWINKYTVTFNTNGGTTINDVTVREGSNVGVPATPSKDNMVFGGWYSDANLTTVFNFGTVITKDTTIFAKWNAVNEEHTVTFKVDGVTVDTKTVENGSVTLPTAPTKVGHEFAGWYDGDTKFVNGNITASLTLVAKFNPIKFSLSIDKDGGVSSEAIPELLEYDTNYTLPTLTKKNYIFGGYEDENGVKYQAGSSINVKDDINLVALWTFDANNASLDSSIQFSKATGSYESATLTWNKVKDVEGYNVYIKKENSSTYTKLTDKNYYLEEKATTLNLYLLGLEADKYDVKVVPTVQENEFDENSQTATVEVEAYDRSGYAHFNYEEGVGAYNNDGTLKVNAIVLYVTDVNKNTVTLSYKGKTVSGIGNILNSVGSRCSDAGHENECKKVSNGKTYYGKANTNENILLDLATDNIPLVVRFVGCVSNTGLYKPGTFDAKSTPLIEGLTAYDAVDYGGSDGDNGHMARIKSAKNVTLEGVGAEATIDGWGFHLICETAYKDYAKNFEVRNLAFINTPEDAIGMEGQQQDSSKTITASVERCWVHHNTFIGPKIENPAEGDKAEGDGSCDFKRGQYFTCSYNYYESCHKTNLVGSSDSSLQYNLSYHHNIWVNCESRIPLLRQANCHFYNNYIIGGQTASYVSDIRANSYLFAEANYYEGCKNVIDSIDSGAAAKLYNNVLVGTFSKFNINSVITTDRESTVTCNTAYKDTNYANFDTNPNLFYYDSVNKKSDCYLTSAAEARLECLKEAGSGYRTVLNLTAVKTDYSFYTAQVPSPISLTTDYTATFPSKKADGVVGGINYTNVSGITSSSVTFKNVGMTFKLTDYATLNIKMTTKDAYASAAGFVVNTKTGELVLSGTGEVVLAPGTYAVVSAVAITNVISSSKNNSKETTVTSFTLTRYESEELNQKLVEAYNIAASNIPATIVYDLDCYNRLTLAMDAYEVLSQELKAQVTIDYNTVVEKYNEYKTLGEAYVVGLITSIGTVDANSGDAIISARLAYNTLVSRIADANVSNYETLVNAENSYKQFAITNTIAYINEIGTVTLNSEEKIVKAETAYANLTDEQKSSVTNYQTLTAARAKYDSLVNIAEVERLIETVDLTKPENMIEVLEAYNTLTADEKTSVSNANKLSNIKVQYIIVLTDSLPQTITKDDGEAIENALAVYNTLTADEKALVTNYDKLSNSKTAYDTIMAQAHSFDFEDGNTVDEDGYFKVTGSGVSLKSLKETEYKTYNGVTYKKALKVDSKPTITFTSGAATLTIVVLNTKTVKVDGKEYTPNSNGVITVELAAGTHTITKGNGENSIYLIIVE